MKKITIIIVILIVVIVGIYLVVSNNKPNTILSDNSQTSNTVIPPNTQSQTTTTTNVSISISNFSFNPATLNIKTGTKVIWTNNDSVAHTVTSDSGNLLNSPTLSPGQSFSFTFTNTGTTNYHCNIHKAMKGVVIVE